MSSHDISKDMKFSPDDERLIRSLRQDNYVDIKRMPNGDYVALFQFMYTWAIMSGLSIYGYEDRWCYSSYEKAKAALDAWDGTGEPEGWHRHPNTGRRRHEDGTEEVWR